MTYSVGTYVRWSNTNNAVTGTDYITTIFPNTYLYMVPATIEVTVNGAALNNTEYTYNYDNSLGSATLTIPGNKITGAISITVGNAEERSRFTLSIVKTHCKSSYVKVQRWSQGIIMTQTLYDGDKICYGENLLYHGEAQDGYQTASGKTVIDGNITVTADISITFKFDTPIS